VFSEEYGQRHGHKGTKEILGARGGIKACFLGLQENFKAK
jgi:hypothetical protein